jgi:hypothetical protein
MLCYPFSDRRKPEFSRFCSKLTILGSPVPDSEKADLPMADYYAA